jgi:two-component system, OmpR family, sensor histidine kinase VicK
LRILTDPEKTEVVYGPENIIRREVAAFPDITRKMDGCYDYSGPSALVTTESIWSATRDLARRGIRLRFITDITNENISYCKQLLEYVELRHLNGAKGNFGIADWIDCVIHSVLQEEHTPVQAIFTNVKSFVEAQQYLFDTLLE